MQILKHYHANPDSFSSSVALNTSLSCIPKAHSLYYYTKETDQSELPEKGGYYETRTKDGRELYAGKFVLDNEHGSGIYKWVGDEGTTVYEGYIYCNFIEGYGRFSYPDGSVHEGLYKNNRRYGPGVYTEPNGKQDVGMWRNQKLIKLSVNVNAQVPTLSQTREGKARAIRFKELLEVKKYKDIAKDILLGMNAPPHILEISDSLYNALSKDSRSETFNWKPYEAIHTEKISQLKLEELVRTIFKPDKKNKFGKPKKKAKGFKWKDFMDEMESKKLSTTVLAVNATHLISWNNSSVMKDMLLFCFKHMFQEDSISFEVANITKGKRECFRAPGTHETLCVRFLKKCQIGDHSRVHDYLAFKCIDPNVADAKGNTGLIIAAANDQLAVIDVLLDRGADINLCNDDGFTPLALCITRYLGLVNNFKDWEKEFLSNLNEINYPENTLKWRHPGKELQSYYRYLDDIADDDIPSWEGSVTKENHENAPLHIEDVETKIALVKETILKLIQRGADPVMSDVPMPVLIMAIKSGDEEIIRSLLEVKFKEGSINQDDPFLEDALYTAVQLPADDAMVSICALLLKYGADPNTVIECLQKDEKLLKFCDLSEDEIGEKRILHYLVTRPDASQYNEHLCAVVKLLLSHGANPDAIYLGHTPLSAAIASGNVEMIKCLVTLQVNPNQKLAKELGVPLTLLMNAQCLENLSITDAMNIVDILVDNGVDLLKDVQVGSFTGNVIEFASKELEEFNKKNRLGRRRSSQNYQVLLDYIIKLTKKELTNKVMEILMKSRQLPTPHTSRFSQATSSQSSGITSPRRGEKKESILPELPSWVHADDIVHILNHIQEQEKSLISKEQASAVLQMVMPLDSKYDDQQQLEKLLLRIKGPSGHDAMGSKASSRKSGEKILKKESWNLLATLKRRRSSIVSRTNSLQSNKNYESNKEISDVCFGCGHTFNQDLLRLCPECKLVKFCSAKCFWKARRNKSHKCTGDMFPDYKDPEEFVIDNDKQDKQQDPRNIDTKQEKREGKKHSKKSTGEKRMKKLLVKGETEIQVLSEKELPKEHKRGADIKTKNRQFHGHPNIKKKQLTKELFSTQSVMENAGIQDLLDKEIEKEELKDEKKTSLGKKEMKKQLVKEETETQDQPEKDLTKEHKRTKSGQFYEHSEIKRKQLTRELFDNESDKKLSKKFDIKKAQNGKTSSFKKYSRGRSDYTYYKVRDSSTTDNIKDSANRLQYGRSDIRKGKKNVSREDYSHLDLNLELMSNQGAKESNYDMSDIRLNVIPHMFRDGSIYYTNDPNKRIFFRGRENYSFN